MNGLDIFVNEFLDYVLSLVIEKDCPINFGNMDFDYCILNVGEILGEVHVDKFGWGRKFLAHATLFLMVPKNQSTPGVNL